MSECEVVNYSFKFLDDQGLPGEDGVKITEMTLIQPPSLVAVLIEFICLYPSLTSWSVS